MVNKVKEYRIKNNLTQKQLGELIGVSRQSIINIESCTFTPSLEVAYKISKVFSVAVEDIFYLN